MNEQAHQNMAVGEVASSQGSEPRIDRRELIYAAGLVAVGLTAAANDPGHQVMTVRGPIVPTAMGVALPHEHILVDFIGADRVHPSRYRGADVAAAALPHLERIKALGVSTFIDCTPAYLGRDARLLRNLSEKTDLHILTNTGYYGASAEKFLPARVQEQTADDLASHWLRAWREGIDQTGIRPGFIKIGMDKSPLSANQKKLVRAAARTHRKSGLTIAAHTGDGAAALEQLAILREEGVAPSAWIWVHAQNEPDQTLHLKVAREGGWVELDGLGLESIEEYARQLSHFKQLNALGRILLSHDAGWYHVGEPGGGQFRPFDTLQSRLIPLLRERGFTAREIERLVVDNPREAFTIRVREAADSSIR